MKSPRKTNKNTSVKESPISAVEAKTHLVKRSARAKKFTRTMKNKIWHNWLTEENYFVNP